MKKKCIFWILILVFGATSAQVKIGSNPTTISSSAMLEIESTNKGLVLPRVANTALITNPVSGMMVYDLSSNCVRSYVNNAWSSCHGSDVSQVLAVECENSSLDGTYATNTAMVANANVLKIRLKNSSFSPVTFGIGSGDVLLGGASAGISVTGVSIGSAGAANTTSPLTIPAISSAELFYKLSGTHTGQGALVATWKKGVLECVKTTTICYADPVIATSTAALAEGNAKTATATPAGGTWTINPASAGTIVGGSFMANEVNADTPVTLAYTVPGGASCTERTATESFTVKNCETITNTTSNVAIAEGTTKSLSATPAGGTWSVLSGVGTISGSTYTAPLVTADTPITLIYTYSSGAPCPTYSSYLYFSVADCVPIVTTGTDLRPIGDTGANNTKTLVASQPNGTWTVVSGGGTVSGNTYTAGNVPENTIQDVVLQYALNAPNPCSVLPTSITFKVIDGDIVYDKNYAQADYRFIYKKVTLGSKAWLNLNLGAAYADVNNSAFNPHLTTGTNAYGSYFQWGRLADGHERTTLTQAGPVAAPVANRFITNSSSPDDWIAPQNNTLWGDGTTGVDPSKTANDPCPAGFKVPSQAQWGSLFSGGTAQGPPNTATNYTWTWVTVAGSGQGYSVGGVLNLPSAGIRTVADGTISGTVFSGYYASSTVNGTNASSLYIDPTLVHPSRSSFRGNGMSVRCIAE